MSLSIDFEKASKAGYRSSMSNPFILSTTTSTFGDVHTSYDFLARIVRSRTSSGDGGITITPFKDLDRDVLECFRQRLIDLGGTPPELPEIEDRNSFSKVGKKNTITHNPSQS